MNITIHTIKVNTIDGVGSLNIGKTVLCRNTSNVVNEPAADASASSDPAAADEPALVSPAPENGPHG
jgi:hypothetical protein